MRQLTALRSLVWRRGRCSILGRAKSRGILSFCKSKAIQWDLCHCARPWPYCGHSAGTSLLRFCSHHLSGLAPSCSSKRWVPSIGCVDVLPAWCLAYGITIATTQGTASSAEQALRLATTASPAPACAAPRPSQSSSHTQRRMLQRGRALAHCRTHAACSRVQASSSHAMLAGRLHAAEVISVRVDICTGAKSRTWVRPSLCHDVQ